MTLVPRPNRWVRDEDDPTGALGGKRDPQILDEEMKDWDREWEERQGRWLDEQCERWPDS
jgi:hypothetical protein